MVRVKDAELQKLRQQVKNLENSLERTTEVSASHCHCNLLGYQSKSLNKQLNSWNKKKLNSHLFGASSICSHSMLYFYRA